MIDTILRGLLVLACFMIAYSVTQLGGLTGSTNTSTTQSIINAAGFTTTGTLTTGNAVFNGLVTMSPTVVSTTTTGSAATLTEADLLAAQYFAVNLNAANDFTYTLPASTTLTSYLTSTGESSRVCFNNATTAAGLDLIFVAGTGIDLETATGTSLIESVGPADSACIDLTRKANTDMHAVLWSFDDSD